MIDYDPDKWRDHLFDIHGSMVREIAARVATVVGWSVLVVVLSRIGPVYTLPLTLHSLVGLALSMLLVFRTNASYDRFWEGRRLWGALINDCRNLARSIRVILADDPDRVAELLGWISAYPYAVMNRLRGSTHLGPAESRLPAAVLQQVRATDHVPLAITIRMSQLLDESRRAGQFSDIVYTNLDTIVQRLIDIVGGCERIHSTPLPYVYVVHLRRCLILYCYALPLALVETYGWATVAATLVVAYTFFGIEEIGVEIEDPFGNDVNDLPLDRYCDRIGENVANVLAAYQADDATV
ncbi:MAG: bestrophin family ion channel [Isosphaeraceae bacterium]